MKIPTYSATCVQTVLLLAKAYYKTVDKPGRLA